MIDRQRLLLAARRRPPQHADPGHRTYPPPLLPDGARKPAAILAVGCLVVIVVLGILSAHQGHGFPVDRAVDAWVIGLGVPLRVLSPVSRIGGVSATMVLTVALAVACLAARRVSGAVLTMVGIALASVLTESVLKPLVHRTITGFLSYPSGHTTGLFALTAAIAVVLLAPRGGRLRPAVRIAAVAAAALVASVVGFAMIGQRFHYFTDTIAGAAVGIGVVIGVAFLLDLPAVRRWLRWPGR